MFYCIILNYIVAIMLKKKLYECHECGAMVVILSKGLCPRCRKKQMPAKKRTPIKSKIKIKPENENYSAFYAECIEELSNYRMSEYSGKPIYNIGTCNICHILPKRIYKSVAKDRRNIIFLTQEEHTRFDYLLDTMDLDKLKIEMPLLYNIVIQRVKLMNDEKSILECGRLKDRIEEEIKKI